MKIFLNFWCVGLVVLALTSCMGMAEADYETEYAQEAPMSGARSEKSAPAPSAAADEVMFGEEVLDDRDESGIEQPREERKRIFNGAAGIIVEDVEDTRDQLEQMAQEAGGYVESSYSDYVVLRVPAELFDEIFDTILELGDVEYSRVETWDVTEAFEDTSRRLSTAEETRSRLYVLLERSTDPTERARILREISRLTEEIELLKQQITLMESRIALSRITIQLIPRIVGDFARADIPFRWIADLNPLTPAGSRLNGRVSLELDRRFAVFTKESVFTAESSDGVMVFISTLDNSPRGDNEFWQKALIHHLSPFYKTAMPREIKIGKTKVLGVEFLSKDREPFKYFVGVSVDRRKLHVVEIFSPSGDEDFSSLYDAFAEGELK
jgi:hypothetical protein